MKLLITVAVVCALGAVVGAIVLGSRVREDTIVAHPYEEGLRYAEHLGAPAPAPLAPAPAPCDLAQGPCTQALPGVGEVTLALGPRPLRTMASLTAEVTLRDPAGPGSAVEASGVALELAMAGMDMGPNRAALAPAGPGAWKGTAVLVRCPSGRRDWEVAVNVARAGAAPARAVFRAVVAE